ncbi:MAG TPA: hypothetical protein PLF71_04165 [bacterium]|nr:hypothetical protein [bacterium]
MSMKSAPPIFARITLGVSALVMVGVVYYYVSQAIKEAPLPPVSPLRQAQGFNVKADVTKNTVFNQLNETILQPIPDYPMGRSNPFVPLSLESAGTSTVPAGGLAVPDSSLKIVPVQAPEFSIQPIPPDFLVNGQGMSAVLEGALPDSAATGTQL